LFVGGIALVAAVLAMILDWYIDPQSSPQRKELVQALAVIIAGVAGSVGIFFTWRGQQITQIYQTVSLGRWVNIKLWHHVSWSQDAEALIYDPVVGERRGQHITNPPRRF